MEKEKITVDLTGKDQIADLENFLEKEIGGKVIEHHPDYSDWQLIQFENPDTYVLVRTVFRLARNVVQLLTAEELITTKMEGKNEFNIIEYSLDKKFTHDDVDQWNNKEIESEERIVNDYYIERNDLIDKVRKLILK